MVGVHLLKIKMLTADRADTLLLFVGSTSVLIIKLTQAQEFLLSCQQILIYTAFLGDFSVCHKSGDSCFQCRRIKCIALMLMIEPSPTQSLHLFTPFRENGIHPVNDALEIHPQRSSGTVVLMLGHIEID